MTHTVVARWFVAPGKMDAARAALAALVKAVEAAEPGTLLYLTHEEGVGSLPPLAAGEIVFVEVYRDEAAFKAHLSGAVFTDFVRDTKDVFLQNFPPNAGPYMASASLNRIAGFSRGGC